MANRIDQPAIAPAKPSRQSKLVELEAQLHRAKSNKALLQRERNLLDQIETLEAEHGAVMGTRK